MARNKLKNGTRIKITNVDDFGFTDRNYHPTQKDVGRFGVILNQTERTHDDVVITYYNITMETNTTKDESETLVLVEFEVTCESLSMSLYSKMREIESEYAGGGHEMIAASGIDHFEKLVIKNKNIVSLELENEKFVAEIFANSKTTSILTDTELLDWLEAHPNVAIDFKPAKNGFQRYWRVRFGYKDSRNEHTSLRDAINYAITQVKLEEAAN